MNISKRLVGGVAGLILGAVTTTILAYIAMSLFYKGGGFVIDFAPLVILIYGVIWGGLSGAIVGFSLLSRVKSLIIGLILASVALVFLFLANAAEKGFGDAASAMFAGGFFSNIGVYCFIVITAFSAFVIGAFNQTTIIKKTAESA